MSSPNGANASCHWESGLIWITLFWHQAGLVFGLSLARGQLGMKLHKQSWISFWMLPKCLGVVRKSPGAGKQAVSEVKVLSYPLAWAVSVLSVGTARHGGEGCLPACGRKCLPWWTSVLSSAEALLGSFLLLMIRKMEGGGRNLPKGLSHKEDVNVSFQ